MFDDGDTETFDCIYKHETARAYLLEIHGEDHWVPKSVCTLDEPTSVKGTPVVAEILHWFVNKEGLS